jgi:hypothetical protein
VNKLSKFSIRFFDSLCFDSIFFFVMVCTLYLHIFSFRTQTLFFAHLLCLKQTLFLSFFSSFIRFVFLSSLKLNIQSISCASLSTKYPPRPTNITLKTEVFRNDEDKKRKRKTCLEPTVIVFSKNLLFFRESLVLFKLFVC